MISKSNSIDMTHGPLWGKILKFTLVFMLTALLQQLYSAADVLIVGRFAGEKALAGVGTCTSLTNLFLTFFVGLSAGTTVVLGQDIGSGNEERTGKTCHTSIALSVIGGLFATVVCFTFTRHLLNMIDVPEDVFSEAGTYLRIISIGFIPSLIYNFGASILRAKGDTKRALYIVSISGIINVVLNIFFVCAFNMGASGVATATVISQIFTAGCILYILCHETDATKIFLRKIRFYTTPLEKILRFGIPSGLQSSLYSISNAIVQGGVNSFGAAAIAGSAASSGITDFYNTMSSSIYQSSMVFSSQNYGAKEFGRIKKVLYVCVTYSFIFWALQALITLFFGEFLIGLYAPGNASVIKMGMEKFIILGYTYGLLCFVNILGGILRGMGASLLSMIASIGGVCGIRILWIYTVFKHIGTFKSLFYCYPISWFGTVILYTFLYIYVFKKEKRRLLNEKRE